MMDIQYSTALIASIEHKHLLLDTNVFRDAVSKPSVFFDFFKDLRKADVTLTTIDFVKYELMKGSSSEVKYKDKEESVNTIIDAVIPVVPETYQLVYKLIQRYGIAGTAVNITDLFLGAILMQYKGNIYLMTRDTSDFIQSIFDLSFVVNIPFNKGIFTYGIYQYTK